MTAVDELPPGQVWGKRFVIYAALGIPRINPKDWRLAVDGLVEQPGEYTYDQLTSSEMTHYVRSFHCLVRGSVVCANPEPLEIEKLTVGDYIIGADGRRHRIKRLISYNHSGEVIAIKAAYLPPALMTPDHPVMIVDGHPGVGRSESQRRQRTFVDGYTAHWVRADEVKLGDYTYFPKYTYVSSLRLVSFEDSIFKLDNELAYILGWYVAAGSPGSSDGRVISFALGKNDEPHLNRLRVALEDVLGASTSVYSNERGTLLRVVVTSSRVRHLVAMMKSWCGEDAQSKRIPAFIMNASAETLRTFLRVLFEGDGYNPSKTGKGNRRCDFIDLTTSSKALAYQALLALSKLGIPGYMVNHRGSVSIGFSVRVRGAKARILFPELPSYEEINKVHYWETREGFYFPVKARWTEPYTGPVYDFQAPGFTMLSPFATQDCVTRWSIKDAEWEGVPLRTLVEPAEPLPGSEWIMFHCADGYTAPVPVEDALRTDAILAVKINGKPLSAEQGFPARPFIPNLYGWKSAKWLNRIEFIRDYRDGYWETYGYHERADVSGEERFKGRSGKAVKRTALGTA